METAGKFVDDESLRAALKENGIGRPSSRAGIIETLFKRHYIRRERKNLVATSTGIELIDTIHEELLKSCELTGIWEKKLRDIEHQKYDPALFINELKQQINDIVNDVLADNSNHHVAITTEEEVKKGGKKKSNSKTTPSKVNKTSTNKVEASTDQNSAAANTNENASHTLTPSDTLIGQICPVCGQGHIIKGKSAYGCSNWKNGCTFKIPFKSK
jgi:DNA topoisomerase-3